MAAKAFEQIIAHLQSLGYEIVHEDERIYVKSHSVGKYSFHISQNGRGIQFLDTNSANAYAKQDRAGYLEYINNLNNKASVARYYTNKECRLFILAWYPYLYDQVAFDMFFDDFEDDRSYSNLAASKYFGETEEQRSRLLSNVPVTDLSTRLSE
jgi:hypothetical protein